MHCMLYTKTLSLTEQNEPCLFEFILTPCNSEIITRFVKMKSKYTGTLVSILSFQSAGTFWNIGGQSEKCLSGTHTDDSAH